MSHLDRKTGSLSLTSLRFGLMGNRVALLISFVALLGRLLSNMLVEGFEQVCDFVRWLPVAATPPEVQRKWVLAPIALRPGRSIPTGPVCGERLLRRPN